MIPSSEIKVTTEILLKGALIFTVIDVVLVTVLTRKIKPADLKKMKWSLIALMALFFSLLFCIIMSYLYWDSVYSYVFPNWARWVIPPTYGLLFATYGLFVFGLSFRLRTNAILNFCLFGGLWGIITHLLAINRGILNKPPMLQGANPYAALAIAAFEFIFYWCICLSLTHVFQLTIKRLRKQE